MTKLAVLSLFAMVLPALVFASTSYGHSGRTDSRGGHHDRKNGGYHFHGGSPARSLPSLNARIAPRVAPRTEARRAPRLSYYKEKRESLLQSVDDSPSSASAKTPTLDAQYVFHHVRRSPYQVVEFSDVDEMWRVLLTKKIYMRLAKRDIVRIEPTEDPTDFRTWIDTTGNFSTVARFSRDSPENIELVTYDARTIRVSVERLSRYDQEHLEKIRQLDSN